VKVDTAEGANGDSNGALLASEAESIRTAPRWPLIDEYRRASRRRTTRGWVNSGPLSRFQLRRTEVST
jgi:hypothetical protein